jgi:hypothetical protein
MFIYCEVSLRKVEKLIYVYVYVEEIVIVIVILVIDRVYDVTNNNDNE